MFPFYKKLKIKEITDIFNIFITKDYIKAIEYSYEYFMNKYNFEIKNILKEYPENSKDKEGKSFYIGSKHVLLALSFNINDNIDNLIINYIKTFADLIFDNLGLIKNEAEKNIKDDEIKKICFNLNLTNYEGIDNKSLLSEIKYNKEYCQNFIQDIHKKIKDKLSLNSLERIKFKEINFEKDSKNKNQYNFIYSCSNLRAINYQIPQSDFIKIKTLSSNIIPSIVTSNAVITGLVSMQIYLLASLMIEKEKYNNNLLETKNALRLFRNYYIDLGKNNYSYSYIPEKILITNNNLPNKYWSAWDSITIKGPLLIRDLIKEFYDKYDIRISSIFSGNSMLYNAIHDEKENIEKKVECLYQKVTGLSISEHKKYLVLEINSKTSEQQELKFPKIKYIISSK